MTCHAGLPTVRLFYSFLHCRDRKEGKQKRKKKNIEPAAKKKIEHSAGSGGRGIYVQINNLFQVAG